MYEYETKIRYTESDAEGEMTLGAIVDCFQNAFHFEGDASGLGTKCFLDKGQGWFIYFWQIDIARFPKYGESVIVGTFSYEDRGNTEKRNFYIKTTDGKVLVKANSIWSLVDLSSLQILRIPDMLTGCEHQEKLEMEYQKRRIRYDPALPAIEIGRHVVNPLELDSNQHLNNSAFLKIALAALYDIEKPNVFQLCIEYKKQAVKGDLIRIFLIRSEELILDLKSVTDESLAVIKLSTL